LPPATTGEWKFPSAPGFPECQLSGTRGRNSSPSVALAEEMHSGKRGFPEWLRVHGTRGWEALGEGPLPRMQHSGKWDTYERKMMWEMEIFKKHSSPSASSPSAGEGTRGIFLKFFVSFFLKSSHIIWNSLLKFVVILNVFGIFHQFFHFVNFFSILQVWTAGAWSNEIS
jgi:hypothetical protein